MRVECIGAATLYLADCRDVLPSLSGIDAVITDPPYGIGFKYDNHNDSDYGPEGYGAWLWNIIEMSEQLCSPGAPIFVWQTQKSIKHFRDWFPRDWRFFVAAKNFVQMRPTPMQYSWDPVLAWWVDGQKPWTEGTANRDFHIANTALMIGSGRNGQDHHPCQRSLDQVSHIIRQWVRPASVCLDPFMGSGTTGVACISQGRSFTGVEIDPGYFAIACRRIEAATRQADLFVPQAPQLARSVPDLFAPTQAAE